MTASKHTHKIKETTFGSLVLNSYSSSSNGKGTIDRVRRLLVRAHTSSQPHARHVLNWGRSLRPTTPLGRGTAVRRELVGNSGASRLCQPAEIRYSPALLSLLCLRSAWQRARPTTLLTRPFAASPRPPHRYSPRRYPPRCPPPRRLRAALPQSRAAPRRRQQARRPASAAAAHATRARTAA